MNANPIRGCIRGSSQVIGVSLMKMWLPIKVLLVVLHTAQFEGVRLLFLEVGANTPARCLTAAGKRYATAESNATSFSTMNAEPTA